MASGEIEISQLELADEVLADMVTPVEATNKTMAITLKQLRKWLGSSLPTGFILPAVGKISDERFTLLDGKTLSRAGTYEAFCNKVVSEVQAGNWFSCSEEEYNLDISKYGQCGRFVVSNDYVRIPKITRFIGATITLSEIGKTYKESLPNITGKFAVGNTQAPSISPMGQGAFVDHGVSGGTQGASWVAAGTYYDFDASRSSSTYQDGAKVQPDHTKYPYYMVISTEGQTAEVGVDINKVYEDLELKANSNLSNVSSVDSSFKNASVGWGLPDYTAGTSIAWNTDVSIAKNGYVVFEFSGKGGGGSLIISINGVNVCLVKADYGNKHSGIIPVAKGNKFKATSSNADTCNFTFYPCLGV